MGIRMDWNHLLEKSGLESGGVSWRQEIRIEWIPVLLWSLEESQGVKPGENRGKDQWVEREGKRKGGKTGKQADRLNKKGRGHFFGT